MYVFDVRFTRTCYEYLSNECNEINTEKLNLESIVNECLLSGVSILNLRAYSTSKADLQYNYFYKQYSTVKYEC